MTIQQIVYVVCFGMGFGIFIKFAIELLFFYINKMFHLFLS